MNKQIHMLNLCEYLQFIDKGALKAIFSCAFQCTKIFLSMMLKAIFPSLQTCLSSTQTTSHHMPSNCICKCLLCFTNSKLHFSNSLQHKSIAKSSWRSIYWRISNWRGLWFPEEKFWGSAIWKQTNRRQGLWSSGRWRFRRIWFLWI